MKRILPYLVFTALLLVGVYVHTLTERKLIRDKENSLKRVNELKEDNDILRKLNDSLLIKSVKIDSIQDDYEKLADSLRDFATTLEPSDCTNRLQTKEKEVKAVRVALNLCKESKAIHVARYGLAEMQIVNEVSICTELRHIDKSDLKQQKRKSFLKGLGVGGAIVLILVLL